MLIASVASAGSRPRSLAGAANATLVYAGAADPTYLDPALVSDGESFQSQADLRRTGRLLGRPGSCRVSRRLVGLAARCASRTGTFNFAGCRFHDGTRSTPAPCARTSTVGTTSAVRSRRVGDLLLPADLRRLRAGEGAVPELPCGRPRGRSSRCAGRTGRSCRRSCCLRLRCRARRRWRAGARTRARSRTACSGRPVRTRSSIRPGQARTASRVGSSASGSCSRATRRTMVGARGWPGSSSGRSRTTRRAFRRSRRARCSGWTSSRRSSSRPSVATDG